jgi:hypothetical protein
MKTRRKEMKIAQQIKDAARKLESHFWDVGGKVSPALKRLGWRKITREIFEDSIAANWQNPEQSLEIISNCLKACGYDPNHDQGYINVLKLKGGKKEFLDRFKTQMLKDADFWTQFSGETIFYPEGKQTSNKKAKGFAKEEFDKIASKQPETLPGLSQGLVRVFMNYIQPSLETDADFNDVFGVSKAEFEQVVLATHQP